MEKLNRSYSELIKLHSFDERLEYLKLLDDDHSSPRHMSKEFYSSDLWKNIRTSVIKRDMRFDLGVFGIYIEGRLFVHHINPIEEYDIINLTPKLLSPDNLICTSLDTHNAIHYKNTKEVYIERKPGDTTPW